MGAAGTVTPKVLLLWACPCCHQNLWGFSSSRADNCCQLTPALELALVPALVLAGLPAKELCERGKQRRLQDFSLGLGQMCIISCKPCRCILLHPDGHGRCWNVAPATGRCCRVLTCVPASAGGARLEFTSFDFACTGKNRENVLLGLWPRGRQLRQTAGFCRGRAISIAATWACRPAVGFTMHRRCCRGVWLRTRAGESAAVRGRREARKDLFTPQPLLCSKPGLGQQPYPRGDAQQGAGESCPATATPEGTGSGSAPPAPTCPRCRSFSS